MAEEQKNLFTPILIGGLIVASFFIGMLYTKVQTYEKNGKTDPKQNEVVADDNQAQVAENTVGEFLPISSDDHIQGDLGAPVTIIEYSDFQCPYCARFNETMVQVMQDYAGKVAWVYRHFPLGFHQYAQKYAEASECVAELGGNNGFWKFAEALYGGMTETTTPDDLQSFVTTAGVDYTAFKTCFDSGKYTQKVQDQMADGTKAGITGTPGNILVTADGQTEMISGAYPIDQLKPIIDKYIK